MCVNVAQFQLVKEQDVAIEELLGMNNDVTQELSDTFVLLDRYQYGFLYINTALGIPIGEAEQALNNILRDRNKNDTE